ncbi:hypothetical protein [Rhodoligotrophos defluvii]|uniref:hypothetical protein n=1 Tax=Rhodoligotrophos defluvii TaxID=2561934 RepID=UPI0010C96BF3|nr:hypothetical protein [Rhodoligotrophos defluvii]
MASDAKAKLVDFLDRKAFEPVLRADPDRYSESQRAKLEDVKRATESERERFRNYESAEKVYQMYRDDLSSEPAQEVDRELRDLNLPTLKDVREEFEQLAEELGVRH